MDFFSLWHQAALTSTGYFWMALWAFVLGYIISSLIQVLVTKERMQKAMGKTGPRSMALGTFFGFISSSCSFAALATTRSLFQKGAGLAPSVAFLLASTNLVIELGIVISIFLAWQFVVAEYIGGILLILFAWLFIRITNPKKLIKQARERLHDGDEEHQHGDQQASWQSKLTSREGWQQIGMTYVMEWQMVWKDVLIGFTVAGVIAAFVPESFFHGLFPGAGQTEGDLGFLSLLAQTLIGPFAAFFTFIGSMGNIPLAAVLFGNGVSFAGVMAFIFSDLVVLPVLRINAQYYGWKMSLYILALLLCGLVFVSLIMHYGFAAFGLLPDATTVQTATERDHFKVNYGFILNLIFLAISAVLVFFWYRAKHADSGHGHEHGHEHHHDHGGAGAGTWVLRSLVVIAMLWLAGGLLVAPLMA